jgi:hypothetical protein
MNAHVICLCRIEDHDGHGNIMITDDYNVARRSAEAGKRVYVATFILHESGPLMQVFDWQPLKIWSNLVHTTI